MTGDKFSAVWVSHTSISDFIQCPRAYFLKHVYRDPKTNRKMKLAFPPLSLGQAVHEVIESLSILPVDLRFREPLINKFEIAWKKVTGKKGGFLNKETEQRYRARGEEMLKRVTDNPGPIIRQAVKIKMDLPNYWLSEDENIILCGKIDWLEYLPDDDRVHIIDFKTGKNNEDNASLQLPIYLLLAENCQKRKVKKASYWYLERDNNPRECKLPLSRDAFKKVLDVARKIKLSRTLNKFTCPKISGCTYCKPMEAILGGEAEFVGNDEYGANIFIINDQQQESIVL